MAITVNFGMYDGLTALYVYNGSTAICHLRFQWPIYFGIFELDGKTKHCVYSFSKVIISSDYSSNVGSTEVYCNKIVYFEDDNMNNTGPDFYYFNPNTNNPSTYGLEYVIKMRYSEATNIRSATKREWIESLFNRFTSYHLDPVYVDKTLVNFTDGTYVVRNGALDATSARNEGYKQLLNTYGTFYKGTERELASSFATGLADNQS